MAVGTENPKMYQMSWGFCLPPVGIPPPPISYFSPSPVPYPTQMHQLSSKWSVQWRL